MKNRTITLMATLLAMTTASAQTNAQKMHDLLTAFGESNEYHIQKVKDKENERSYFFTDVWSIDLSKIPDVDPEKLFRPKLSAFFKAFSDYAGEAVETYFHDAPEGDPMIPGVNITWTGKERNWAIGVQASLTPTDYVRLILLKEPDDQRRLFIMTWDQSVKYDSVSHCDMIATHGTIEEYSGYKSYHASFVAPYQKKEDHELPEVAVSTTTNFAELRAKVKRICDIFSSETHSGQSAATVVLHKLCEGYKGKLTEAQYTELLGEVQPLIDKTDEKGLKQLLGYTCYTLYKKSEIFEQTDTIPEQGYVSTATSTEGQFTKVIRYNLNIINTNLPVTMKVSGTTEDTDSIIQLIRYPQREPIGKYPVKNGHFEFNLSLPKDELVHIVTSNHKHIAYICADGQHMNIDMRKGIVKGSKQNKMLSEKLPQVWDAIKNGHLEELRLLATQNRDNILSAIIIKNIYSQMYLDELRYYLSENYPYSQHPLLAPARQYAEGLEKRNPGKPCPNVEVLDENNVLHDLKQYISHQAALLFFWDNNRYSLNQIDRLHAIHKQYPKLKIISIAINQYPREWRRLIETNKMEWTNLFAPNGWDSSVVRDFGINALPETVLIGIDGFINDTPMNMDDLEKSLKELW